MKDFTINIFRQLLETLLGSGYKFYTFHDYQTKMINDEKIVILRHDVDKSPLNSLETAMIESELGIQGTYYFRIVKSSNHPHIIEKIRDLGHEIGYHYEDLTLCNGNDEKAIKMFEENLKYFRSFYPISTICMHGSPMSKYDNRSIWEKYDYKSFSLIAEPYFDLDFTEFFYITDTGRRWDGDKVSVRDKIQQNFNLRIKSTIEFIDAVEKKTLPPKLMITTHPQRWTNVNFSWYYELISQNLKNINKAMIVK